MVEQIVQGFADAVRVIPQTGNADIARSAEHPTHGTRLVAMIHAVAGFRFADVTLAMFLAL